MRQFTEVAASLYHLKQKGRSWEWTLEHQHAFAEFKRCLTKAPELSFLKLDAPFILDTDASDCGLGEVLLQEDKERLNAYAARALSKAERDYNTTRKELLALVWGGG